MKAYAKAGVDVDLGNRVKSKIHAQVSETHGPRVLGKVGGFGGLFRASFTGYRDPVLVSSVDGVGTKLKVAALTGRHDTIGEDLVNHCVNDIAVVGAEPLFFLDYIGTARLEPEQFRQILSGVVRGCKVSGCALIGGETAQMPGIYHGQDYDLVGCIVGVAERKKMIDGRSIRPGDVIIGLPSSGLHTNGYSLARDILFNRLRMQASDRVPGLKSTVGEELLRVHVNYLPVLRKLHCKVKVKGLAHITGGGLVDNLPRILPKKVNAVIHLGSWKILPLFHLLTSVSHLKTEEMYQVFNMGIGMTIVVSPQDEKKTLEITRGTKIGIITKGTGIVELEPRKK
jgi:phosphoribosylformylglycinamidine cyclo-ligase